MPTSINPHDGFLLILTRLQLGLLNEDVANRFDIAITHKVIIYFCNLDKIIEQVVKKFSCLVGWGSNTR